MARRFPIWYFFFIVTLSESRYIFAFGSSLSPCCSLPMMFIHSAFLLSYLSSHILLQNCFASFVSGCWYVFVHQPPACWKNFLSLLLNILFYLYCLILFQYLFSLPSSVSTFWFIWIVLLVLIVVLLFSSRPNKFKRFSSVLSFLLVVVDFLSVFLVLFSIQVLSFYSCSFGEHRF